MMSVWMKQKYVRKRKEMGIETTQIMRNKSLGNGNVNCIIFAYFVFLGFFFPEERKSAGG